MVTPHQARILIADDQADVLIALQLLLKANGFVTSSADSPGAVLEAVTREPFDLVLMDLNYTRDTTSGQEGIDLLERLRALPAPPPVVVMTAWGSLELAVSAMRHGARDFVLKPWDNDKLMAAVLANLAPPAPAAERAIARDLLIARQVQTNLLPQRRPPLATLEYTGACRQAREVGGDYYDFLDLGPHGVALVLADVSGKGIAAALLMSNLQAALRSLAPHAGSLPLLATALHQQFLQSSGDYHFATLFLGVYDDSTRKLAYVNCGHNPPLLARAGGAVERLEPTAPVLGLLPDFHALSAETSIGPGDVLGIYSDGITEAQVGGDLEFGEDGLLGFLRGLDGAALDGQPELLTAQIAESSPGGQADDLTLVLARGR